MSIQSISSRTYTDVRPKCILTLSPFTEPWYHSTFINICGGKLLYTDASLEEKLNKWFMTNHILMKCELPDHIFYWTIFNHLGNFKLNTQKLSPFTYIFIFFWCKTKNGKQSGLSLIIISAIFAKFCQTHCYRKKNFMVSEKDV